MGTVSDLPDLPTELFLAITSFLDPIDVVRCRLVSWPWHREFTDESFLRDILSIDYGETRDVRALLELEAEYGVNSPRGDDFCHCNDIWRETFDRVIARRQALKSGKPRFVTKRDLGNRMTEFLGKQANVRHSHFQIAPWIRHHQIPRPQGMGAAVPTDLLETEWTYDSGLLVYPVMAEIQTYVLLDIEQDTLSVVPFDTNDRIVRRLRLKHNILVFEWAEREAYHQLNEDEEVHRHYVTAFDVLSVKDPFPWLSQRQMIFRSEWKLHYLGFPLSAQDRWFSDHSTTHYAVYIWQTNRSAWGENEPIESLLIWDISQPSSHHPSGDQSDGCQVPVRPQLVKKLSYLDLEFLTTRQRDTPFLRRLALDGSACLYFFEDGCSRESGLHVGHGYQEGRRNDREVVWERVVGIPILGAGPRWEDRLGRASTSVRSPNLSMTNRATLWRYDGMGVGIRNQMVRDESAGINYFVLQRTIGFPEIWVSSDSRSWFAEINLQDIQFRWKQINGDERYLIIQSNEELCILHFDHNFGLKKGILPFGRKY